MLSRNLIRFWWRGDAGRKLSGQRYTRLYDMGPRQAVGDAVFSTEAARPVLDALNGYFGLNVGVSQNAIRNNTMQGAVAGTPGTLPTNWHVTLNGLTREVVAIGVENGVEYIDLRFHGTSTGTTVDVAFEGSTTQVVATPSQVWTVSLYNKILDNTLPPVSHGVRLLSYTSGGGFITSAGGINAITTQLERYEQTITTSPDPSTARVHYVYRAVVVSGQSYDFTIRIGLPQMEQRTYATPVLRTIGTAVAQTSTLAPVPDAIPTTGTIVLWDNMVNAFASGLDQRIFGSEDVSTSFVQLCRDVTNTNRIHVKTHNNTELESADLEWQPANQYKRWFFAMTFDGTTVEVWRGDLQGNLSKVLTGAYTPSSAAVRDLYLGSSATDSQTSQTYTDILTYDAVLSEADIEALYYGTIPILHQTAYAGTFVDKYRQKVQAESGATYDATDEAAVYNFWNQEL